jgi:hypothetical protein
MSLAPTRSGAAPRPGEIDVLNFNIAGEPLPASLPPWVEWDPAAYCAAVSHQITEKLMRSQTARSVIAAIARTVKVRPAKHARDPAAFWQAGENTLFYTPGAFIPGSKLYSASPYLTGYTADAVLLHEVVHAMRTTQGFRVKDQEEIEKIHYPPWSARGDPKNYLFFGKRGEFNAIVIANTYIAEMRPGGSINPMARNRILLVKDHHLGHVHMALAAPDYFHKHPPIRHYLKMLWSEQSALCRAIALAKAEFNPIRDVV